VKPITWTTSIKKVHIPQPKAITNIHVDISSSAVTALTAFAAEKSGERSVIRSQLCLHSRDILRSNRTGRKILVTCAARDFSRQNIFLAGKANRTFAQLKSRYRTTSLRKFFSAQLRRQQEAVSAFNSSSYVCVSLLRLCFAVMTHSMLRRMTLTLCRSSVLAHFFSKEKTTTVSEQCKYSTFI
jgi:hypothetical protein